MTYKVVVKPHAERAIRRLDRATQRRIDAVLQLLGDNPRPPGATAVKNRPGVLRVRTGDYRLLYRVDDAELLVLEIAVGHRRAVYR